MANRGKNLLEAFKAGGASSASPAPSSPPASSASTGSGSSNVSSRAPSLASFGAGPRGSIVLRPAQLQLLLLVQVILVVVAFLVGRRSAGDAVEANERDGGAIEDVERDVARQQPVRETPPPAVVPATLDPLAAQEAALVDRANFYTVKAVEYSNTEAHQKLARATLQYLTDVHGLPACVTRAGTRLFVLIGAAPRQVDLDDLLRTVRRINGPPPASRAAEFHDAYVEKIDSVFPRK